MNNRRAFTLIELLVAISLVLILMVGVSKVFKITSETVSANQGISEHTRDARAAQAVLAQDFSAAVTQGAPCMLFYMRSVPAFRNKADQDADRDGNPMTIDLNGNNVEGDIAAIQPGEVISPATYNARNHRVDIMSFFSRGLFRRQTGGQMPTGDTPFVANMSSSEGWTWMGHLHLPNAAGTFSAATDPGQGTKQTNPQNFYATQWMLGREQILLREPDAGTLNDTAGNPQIYISIPAGSTTKAPLSYDSNTNVSGAGSAFLRDSRYDLAGTSISGYSQRLLGYTASVPAAQQATDNWWSDIFLSNGRRFRSEPFIVKPITPSTLSQQSPIFLRGCTQFIVEVAGDWLIQNNDPTSATYGAVTGVYTATGQGDGVVDYIVTGTGANQRKSIRWYGLPRDTDGDGRVSVGQGTPGTNANLVTDVVPLRDIWRMAQTPGVAPYDQNAPFEKFTYTGTDARATTSLKDYGAFGGTYTLPNAFGKGVDDFYTLAFGANDPKPKLVRITIALDDPSGRTAEAQTFEYVFELP